MRRYNPAEEKKILGLLAQGNKFAFTLLFDHYRSGVYAVAIKFLKSQQLAEEVVQEVFMKVWTKRADFADVVNFNAYLLTMARNLIFDFVKELAKEAVKKKDLVTTLSTVAGADQPLIEEQYSKLLNDAVSLLPPQQKQIFRLARVEGLSQQDIAEQLQISRLTVKAHMAKALHTIRQTLQHHIISASFLPAMLSVLQF